MSPAAVTLEQALDLLRIPRVVGKDPESGEEIVAHNGRFGPYVKRGSTRGSLLGEEQILSVTLEEALAHICPAQDPPGTPGGRTPQGARS